MILDEYILLNAEHKERIIKMKVLSKVFTPVWNFIHGFWLCIKQLFLTVFGKIRIYRYPMWIAYDPKGYDLTATKVRKIMRIIQPGDVICRRYNNFLDGYFIPGRFSHSGIYIGETEDTGDARVIIHAMGDGVQMIDILDFVRCDGIAILRPKCDGEMKKKALERARSYLGYTYDFNFDILDDYKNSDEVDAHSKSMYCHEMTRSCYPDLNIPTITPSIWNGMIRSSKRQFLAQSFFDSPDFELIYDSDYSDPRCSIK